MILSLLLKLMWFSLVLQNLFSPVSVADILEQLVKYLLRVVPYVIFPYSQQWVIM